MDGNRERLIALGLYKPLSSEEIARRNGILARMAEGEKVDSCVRPNMCVFRSDMPYTHILLSGDQCCKDAELIAEKVTYWEAQQLCNRFNWNDPKLPLTYPKSLYRHHLYKICSLEDWAAWLAEKAQISFFDREV